MEIGEQHLLLPQHLAFGGLRLLHLDDHLGLGEDLGGVLGDRRAGRFVDRVGDADAGSGAGLNENLVPMGDGLADAGRDHADAVFVDLDFLGHADLHGRPSFCAVSARINRWANRSEIVSCRPIPNRLGAHLPWLQQTP